MPIVQIDWDSIKTLFADDTEFIALTSRQRAFLLSLSEQLDWRKTFDAFGYDWSDGDDLSLEIADLQHNLIMPVNLQDLLGYIDEIEDLLRLLQNPSVCCEDVDWTDGEQYTEPVDEGSTNGVPQALVDAGWADDTDDWEGFEDWMCAVGNVLVNNMQSKVVSLEDVFDNAGLLIVGAGALLGLLGIVFSSGISILVAGILTAAGSAQKLWDRLNSAGADWAPTPEEIELSRQELVCAWLDPANDGIDDRITAFHDAIDAEFSLIEAEILKLLMHRQMIKALYTGSWEQSVGADSIAQKMYDAGITPSTYTCDCETDLLATYDFTSDEEGFQTSGGLPFTWLSASLVESNVDNTGSYRYNEGDTGNEILTRFSITGSTITISKIKMRWQFYTPGAEIYWELIGGVRESGTDAYHDSDTYDSTSEGYNTWIEKTFTFASPVTIRATLSAIYFKSKRTASAAAGQRLHIDWLKLYGTVS